ncbi:MAG: 3-oxo-5-alpha-steroid 4-dehydrogenase, partial [Saprospiraceae bacterium]
SNRWGWLTMESVSFVVLSIFFLSSPGVSSKFAWFAYILWSLHYIHRSFIFPFRTKTGGKLIPLSIVFSAIFFNVINAGTNGYYLGYLENYSDSWFSDPRFVVGLILFSIGVSVNVWADNYLIRLRSNSSQGYQIPRGGFFEYISCPNHFGEMVEWIGFAVMSWNLPACAFAIWTIANLFPRAWSHHRWYRKEFVNYPSDRKAVIPFLL